MKWILQVIYAVICGLTIWGIYVIKRNKVLRFNEGQLIEGKIIGIKELMGRPVRYIGQKINQLKIKLRYVCCWQVGWLH